MEWHQYIWCGLMWNPKLWHHLLLHFHCSCYAGHNTSFLLEPKDNQRSSYEWKNSRTRRDSEGRIQLQPAMQLRKSLLKCWEECPEEAQNLRGPYIVRVDIFSSFFSFFQLLRNHLWTKWNLKQRMLVINLKSEQCINKYWTLKAQFNRNANATTDI